MESAEDKISLEKKKRRWKTSSQVESLENYYGENKYPSQAMRTQLSIQLGLSEKQIVAWFARRRVKDKKLIEEEVSDNGKQNYHNEVERYSSGSGENVDPQSYLKSKQTGNPRATEAIDYPAAVLASELRDHDLFTLNNYNVEDTYLESSSGSQERSSLPSGNPADILMALRCLSQNVNRHGTEDKRKKSESFHVDRNLQENYEHEAVIAVKEQLGEEYRDDGPPLSVEFDLIPPGAFDSPMDPYYDAECNDINDFHRTLNMVKEPQEGWKVFNSHRLHAPCPPRYPSTQSTPKFESASPNFERARALQSFNGKYNWTPLSSNVPGGSFHAPGESPLSRFDGKCCLSRHKLDETNMPVSYCSKNGPMVEENGTKGNKLPICDPKIAFDPHYNVSKVNSIVNDVQSGGLPSSQVEDKAQIKKMTKNKRVREERRILTEQECALEAKQKLMEKKEKRIKRERRNFKK